MVNNTETVSSYFILDNGGHIFKVEVSNDRVDVYRRNTNDPDVPSHRSHGVEYEDKPVLRFHSLEKVFVGTSPGDMPPEFNRKGHQFDGNTILLQTARTEYISICNRGIFSFRTNAEITDYYSPVGNSDVPYPYAVDADKTYYLLLDSVMISGIPQDVVNPYKYYYNNSDVLSTLSYGIAKLIISDKEYTMSYNPNPAKDYDRITADIGPMYTVTSGGKKTKLEKQKYVNLLEAFGDLKGYAPMEITKILYERPE